MFNTVNHTGLTVSSVDESLKFYRDTLGLAVEEARSGEWSGAFMSYLDVAPEGGSWRVRVGGGVRIVGDGAFEV